jgi:hypothetical protein
MRSISLFMMAAALASGTLLAAGCGSSSRHLSLPGATTASSAPASTPVSSSAGTDAAPTPPPAVAIESATTSPTLTTPSSSVPTLGTSAPLQGYALDGAGFGEVKPSEVYLGGDATGRIYGIVWQT